MSVDATKNRNKRKKIFVDKPFQFHWLAWFLINTIVVVSLCVVLFNFYAIWRGNEGMVNASSWNFNFMFLIVVYFLMITVLIWTSIKMTHKAAGPIYRFRKVIDAIINGEFQGLRIKLRKKDEFINLATDFNRLLEFYESRNRKLDEISTKIAENTEEIEKALSSQGVNEVENKKALECIENIRKATEEIPLS